MVREKEILLSTPYCSPGPVTLVTEIEQRMCPLTGDASRR